MVVGDTDCALAEWILAVACSRRRQNARAERLHIFREFNLPSCHSDLAWAVTGTVNIYSRRAGCSASVSVRNHSRSRGTAGKLEHQ